MIHIISNIIQSLDFLSVRGRERLRKMQSAKEKVSNMASSAKEHVNIYKAKAEEKVYIYIYIFVYIQ